MQTMVIPKMFEAYPEAEKLVNKFASKILETLSSESSALHVWTVIRPELYKKYVRTEQENTRVPMSIKIFCNGLL